MLTPDQTAFDSLAALQGDGAATGLLFQSFSSAPAGWTVVQVSRLLQMVHDGGRIEPSAHEPLELMADDVPEMLALVERTRPGPFGRRTRELGSYLGIHQAAEGS